MVLKAAFIVAFPESDPKKHRAVVETPAYSLTVVFTKDVDEAANIAKDLVKEGIQIIELCVGFGPVGAAKVIEAVGDKIPVGSVGVGIESVEKIANLLKEKGVKK